MHHPIGAVHLHILTFAYLHIAKRSPFAYSHICTFAKRHICTFSYSHIDIPMTIRHLFLSLCFLPAAAFAQDEQQIEDCFLRSLQGETLNAPRKRIHVNKISAARDLVWKAWQKANAAFNEEKLIVLDSLTASQKSIWHIPAELEPNAAMPYYYGAKGTRPTEGYPLFLYLHGSGPKDNEWANGLYFGQHFADAPSAYFIPRIPQEGEWYRWWQKGKQYVWDKLLRQTLASGSFNPNRLYVFGISEGGYGSQRLASFYADYWAAAGPMAGGEPLKNAPAENLSNVAFSLRTGAEDKGFYRNILSRYIADELDSLESLYPTQFRHSVQLIPGQGHHIDYTKTTPWMSHFTRNARPQNYMWEDYEMDGQHRRGFYNLLVTTRPDSTKRTRYDYRTNRDSNLVEIFVEDVTYKTTERDPIYGIEMKFSRTYEPSHGGRLTVFLNEDMVNLRIPVTIRINGRNVFYGTPRCDVEAMMRSLAAFYDPERIFPAAVNVKY